MPCRFSLSVSLDVFFDVFFEVFLPFHESGKPGFVAVELAWAGVVTNNA
jgi:hypothetical protein